MEQDITKLIKIDEVSLRLENLHYSLANHIPTQQLAIEERIQRTKEKIKYNESLYRVLTGNDFVYQPLRREAA